MFQNSLVSKLGFGIPDVVNTELNFENLEYWFRQHFTVANNADQEKMHLFVLNLARVFFSESGILDYIKTNLKENEISRYAGDFLLDTVRYILTGKRQLNISVWLPLLSEGQKQLDSKKGKFDRKAYLSELNLIVGTTNESDICIANWLKHRYGFKDLVMTLYYLMLAEKE